MDQKNVIDSHIQPFAKQRIHDYISQQINQLISEGLLKPGDQLPPERELAKRFKVSRNSVRDALRTLEARGLLEIRQGGGTYVNAIPVTELYQNLIEVLGERRELIREVLQARQILEPNIAYVATNTATSEQLQELERILVQHEEKAQSGDPGVREDEQFHLTIAQMTQNQYLTWLIQLMNEAFTQSRDLLLEYSGSAARIGHRRILDALKNHDPEAARKAMVEHLDEVQRSYELIVEIEKV